MINKSSLLSGTISNVISLGVNIVIGFALTPFIITKLGKEGYGIWVIVMSIVGYYGLLDIGLHSASIRYISYYIGEKNRESLRQTISTSIFIFAVIGASVVILSLLLAKPISVFFRIGKEYSLSFEKMVILVGIATGIGFIRRILDAVMIAYEKFVLLNVLGTILILIRALLLVLALITYSGLEVIGWVEIIVETLNIGIKILIIYHMTSELSISFGSINKSTAKLLISFGVVTFITLIGDMLRFNVDTVVIGRYINIEAVAIYGVASTLVRFFLRLGNASTLITFPRLSVLAGDNMQDFKASYMKFSQLTSIFITGISLEIVLLSPAFISIWVGDTFADSAPIAIILAISLSTDLSTSISINAMKALNIQRFYAIQTILEGIANLVLSIILVQYYGIIGVALGTAIPNVINKIIIQPIYSSKIIGVEVFRYYSRTILRPMGSGIIVGLIFFAFGVMNVEPTVFNLVMHATALGCVYFICSYFTCLDVDLRNEIAETLAHSIYKIRQI